MFLGLEVKAKPRTDRGEVDSSLHHSFVLKHSVPEPERD